MNFRTLSIPSLVLILMGSLSAQSRIAEITEVNGVRPNKIRGIGLVTGLNNSGDQSTLARRMISNMVKRLHLKVDESEISDGNAAVVWVDATLDPFKRPGSRIDVTVSSFQDARSLFGGVLAETHLLGFDRKTVYAVAEGPLTVGGVSAEGRSGSSVTVNHPTVGTIPGGALVERGVEMRPVDERGRVSFDLRRPNWRTAQNIADAINKRYPGLARARDAGRVEVTPRARSNSADVTALIAEIQSLRVRVDSVSKVVINERSGIITAGADVRISTVAVAYGQLSVTVDEQPQPAAAAPFTEGPGIITVPNSGVDIVEERRPMKVLDGGETVGRLTQALNALGATPRQLIEIFKAIDAAGALHAELLIQ